MVTDKLRSHGAAMKIIGNAGLQICTGRRNNNRGENSRQPFRRCELAMLRFRRMGTLQKFATVHGTVYNHFNSQRHLTSRETYTTNRLATMTEWQSLMA